MKSQSRKILHYGLNAEKFCIMDSMQNHCRLEFSALLKQYCINILKSKFNKKTVSLSVKFCIHALAAMATMTSAAGTAAGMAASAEVAAAVVVAATVVVVVAATVVVVAAQTEDRAVIIIIHRTYHPGDNSLYF